MTITATEAKSTPAQKEHAAAVKASAAAADAIGPANDNVQAARDALAAAETEAVEALTTKSADPEAAKTRIETARAAIKAAEDNLSFAILQLHAAEVVEQRTRADEEAARRRVIVEEYRAAAADFDDPQSRENVLLAQLASTLAELIPTICERRDKHDRLAQAWQNWQHLPADERPAVPKGSIEATSTRLVGDFFCDLTPEVAAAIRAGAAAAQTELARRERARRFG